MLLLLSVILSVCVSWARGQDPSPESLFPESERTINAQGWEVEDLLKPRLRENARRLGQLPPRFPFRSPRLPLPSMFKEHCCMPVFENAIAVITGKPFKLNDKLDYKCLDGYENRDGNTTGSMVCDKDGWTHLPTCYKSTAKCGRPPAINNGDVTSFLSETYLPGSRVEYQCQAYYELQGSPSVTCSDAKWSEPPRCIAPCVISEENMNKNKIRLKWKDDKKHYSKTGDIVEFTCAPGHHATTSGESFRVLCQEGTMEYPRCE